MERLLRTIGQLARDLLLRAPKDEGAQGSRERVRRSRVRGTAMLQGLLKCGGGAQHPGIQELEQAPHFAEVILE